MSQPLLQVEDARLYFPVRSGVLNRVKGWVKAVDGVSLEVDPGEALGLVGESGCGKTTLMNGVLQLDRLTEGRIVFDGEDLSTLTAVRLRHLRRFIQAVFQDPFWSLNPRWLVRDIVGEPLRVHDRLGGHQLESAVSALLEKVEIPQDAAYKYPHEFSGGLRQRIAIARALALNPKMVVLDEPTSAIDVLSQHQILSLLSDLKDQMGLTFILVSHDLSVVKYLSTRVGVMYLGKIVEYGSSDEVLARPAHPYTQAMLRAVPDPETVGSNSLLALSGDVPSALHPPKGCRFHTRCPERLEDCSHLEPEQIHLSDTHYASCLRLR